MTIVKWLPNILTFSRIILSFFLFYFISQQQFTSALIILLTAFTTDLIDGAIARHYQAESKVGEKALEPLADGLLVYGTVFGFVCLGRLPVWIIYLFIVGAIIFISYTRISQRKLVAKITFYYIQPIAYGIFIVFVSIYLAVRILPFYLALIVVILFLISAAILKRKRLWYFISVIIGQRQP